MSTTRTLTFAAILLSRNVIRREQLAGAEALAAQVGVRLPDALVKLGYATSGEVTKAVAEAHGLQYVDLTEVQIPLAVVELVPESVARENVLLPLAVEGTALVVAV